MENLTSCWIILERVYRLAYRNVVAMITTISFQIHPVELYVNSSSSRCSDTVVDVSACWVIFWPARAGETQFAFFANSLDGNGFHVSDACSIAINVCA
jgi:hypothetical protein